MSRSKTIAPPNEIGILKVSPNSFGKLTVVVLENENGVAFEICYVRNGRWAPLPFY